MGGFNPGALNPVIQAFLQSREQASQDFNQGQQKQLEREKLKQSADEFTKQLDQQKQLELQRIELERKVAEFNIHKGHAETLQNIAKMVQAGQLNADNLPSPEPNELAAMGTPMANPKEYAKVFGEIVSRSALINPEQSAATQANVINKLAPAEASRAGAIAGAQTQATEQAKQPFDAVKAQQEFNNQVALRATNFGYDEKLAKIHGDYQLAAARIESATHLQGIRLQNEVQLDPDAIKGSFYSVLNGDIPLSQVANSKQKSAVESIFGKMGWEVPNAKNVQDAVTHGKTLESLLDTYTDLAKNYSIDSEGHSDRGNKRVSTPFGSFGYTTNNSDLASKLASAQSMGGALASFFDDNKRKSDQEILRSVNGLFDPKATREQNLQKIEMHKKQLVNGVLSFLPRNTEEANVILGNAGITGFNASGTPKTSNDKDGHKTGDTYIKNHDGVNYNVRLNDDGSETVLGIASR